MLLSKEDKEKLEKIRNTDYLTITNGTDNGIPFLKYVFDLHYKIFGETCQFCPTKITGYIQKLKKFNPNTMKKTSNSELFRLNERTTIPVAGTSLVYSNDNLTDEIAVELLAKNPNRKVLFQKLPENWEKLVKDFKPKEPKVDTVTTDMVVLGELKFTQEVAKDTLKKIGLTTRATSLSGTQKAVDTLVDVQIQNLIDALPVQTDSVDEEETNDSDNDDTGANDEPKTLDQLNFDLEKAEQDLEDLIAVTQEEEKLSPARAIIAGIKEKIDNFVV